MLEAVPTASSGWNRHLAPQASHFKRGRGRPIFDFGAFRVSGGAPDRPAGAPDPPGDGIGRGDGRNEGSGASAGRRCRPPPGYSWWPGRAVEAGIKRVINGPMIWSPDSNVLFGPVPELKNYFCCNGIIPGFSQSGGMGLLAAEWIIEGETKYDMFAWDIARFDTWADKEFTKSRVADQYTKRYSIHFPNEERSAGRPVRTRPVYEMQNKLGAVMGLSFGWEHPLWFANEPGVKDSIGPVKPSIIPTFTS